MGDLYNLDEVDLCARQGADDNSLSFGNRAWVGLVAAPDGAMLANLWGDKHDASVLRFDPTDRSFSLMPIQEFHSSSAPGNGQRSCYHETRQGFTGAVAGGRLFAFPSGSECDLLVVDTVNKVARRDHASLYVHAPEGVAGVSIPQGF